MESTSAHESQGRGTPDPIPVGTLLPAVSLPSVSSGAMVDLRGGRGPQVLIVMHSATCTECTAYVRDIVASQVNRLEWEERLVLGVPAETGSAADLARLAPDGRVLADPDRRIACGEAMVVITDEWGKCTSSSVRARSTTSQLRSRSGSGPGSSRSNAPSASPRRGNGGQSDQGAALLRNAGRR